MTEELKPCPFCGETTLTSGGDDKFVGVRCITCEATGPNHYGRYDWNRRADDWRDIESAPRDGTPFDAWGKYTSTGEGLRVTNVKWGVCINWLGQEREDWLFDMPAHAPDFVLTHWQPLPTPPEGE